MRLCVLVRLFGGEVMGQCHLGLVAMMILLLHTGYPFSSAGFFRLFYDFPVGNWLCNNRLLKRIALARWVRHWVCPWIVGNFNELAVYLPEFAESRPAGLQPRAPESVRFSRKTLTHHRIFPISSPQQIIASAA